ncbi:TPA: hypothetical protein ACX6Q2_003411 [Photobacterium damselae]
MSINKYIVFVSYYPEYFKKSLDKLISLNRENISDLNIVVVNNNASNNLIGENKTYDLLVGDNSYWEFSGWEQGLDFLNKKYDLKDEDIIIFANDTFCQHRSFGVIDKYIFEKGFNRLYEEKNIAIGDVDSFGKSFEICSHTQKEWISTYLFGMHYGTVKKILPLSSLKSLEDEIFFLNGEIKGIDISISLRKHLENWLLPNDNTGWYKARKSDDNILKRKLLAILHEKKLSCNLLENDIKLVGVYKPFIFRFFRKIRSKLKL